LVSIYLERRRGGERMKGEEDRGEGEGEEEGMRGEVVGRGEREKGRDGREEERRKTYEWIDPDGLELLKLAVSLPTSPGDAVLEYGCGAKFGSSGIVKLKLNWDPVFCCAKWETG
jgi:hypothetical protein